MVDGGGLLRCHDRMHGGHVRGAEHGGLFGGGGEAGATAFAQRPDKDLVATITGPMLEGGMVSELAWDGGTLVIQTVTMERTGVMKPSYFSTPGRGMDVVPSVQMPPGMARYWKMKSNRVSPTGLGRITDAHDAKMPMYGIASQAQRFADAHEMGGTVQTHALKLHELTIHARSSGIPPYDGEVWSWSPPELNRIAYVDGKGDLWIARADGRDAERVLKGNYTLPAWSDDGRTLAIAERKDGGHKWEISVVHLAEKYRK
jgi:hypothetical protein